MIGCICNKWWKYLRVERVFIKIIIDLYDFSVFYRVRIFFVYFKWENWLKGFVSIWWVSYWRFKCVILDVIGRVYCFGLGLSVRDRKY